MNHGIEPCTSQVNQCTSIWLVCPVVTWHCAVCSDWLISNLCPRFSPDYTFLGFAPFKNGYSEYPSLELTIYHIETHSIILSYWHKRFSQSARTTECWRLSCGVWHPSNIFQYGAQSRTRTDTPRGTWFWVKRVYQFRHPGKKLTINF